MAAAIAIVLIPVADSAPSRDAASAYAPQIYVIASDGSGETNITHNAKANDGPAWSPDGTKLAFSSNRDGNWEIYMMNADGSGSTRLTHNRSADDAAPAWSPDGTKIAFQTDRDGNYEIYVMNADGSAQTNLTKETQTDDASPSWAPDGTRIVFGSEGDLYVVTADGSQQTQLTSGSIYDFLPAWSPDGTKIALGARSRKGAFIDVINADGTGRTRLTHGGGEYEPRWSKDGMKIAYAAYATGLGRIVVMNADGSAATRLTGAPKRDDYDPSWSPDGTKIAFTGYVDTVAPEVLIVGPPRQRVVKQKGVLLLVACNEPCGLRASGVVSVAGQRIKLRLRGAAVNVSAFDGALLKLRLPAGGLRKLRAAFAHQKKVRTVVSVKGVDAAGNARTRTYRAKLRR
ncbi:MAG TPA: DPP IV N-terminal domain-containing protein [Gaiellaceae bacterium]